MGPHRPRRIFFSVFKDSDHKQGVSIGWGSESDGPYDKPLWKVTPVGRTLVQPRTNILTLDRHSLVMGEAHEHYTRSALTIQEAKEASATMIAGSGRLVGGFVLQILSCGHYNHRSFIPVTAKYLLDL